MTSCYPVNTLCLQLHVNLSFHVRVNNQAGEGKIWCFLLLKHFNLDSAAQRVAQLIPYSLPHLLCRQLCNHLPLRPAFHTVDGLSVLCSGLTAAFHVQVFPFPLSSEIWEVSVSRHRALFLYDFVIMKKTNMHCRAKRAKEVKPRFGFRSVIWQLRLGLGALVSSHSPNMNVSLI